MLRFLSAIVLLSKAIDASPQCSSGKSCPHIVMVLLDDLGWNNVPWHNPELVSQMPASMELVKEGVEIDRHYTFLYCSPTRSSLLSGRMPHRVNQVIIQDECPTAGIHRKMTTIPKKLKEAGYATHATGKWHVGYATPDHMPQGRGFDTFLGFLGGGEDHWTQHVCKGIACALPNNDPNTNIDLWHNDGPARGMNNKSYGDLMYAQYAVDTIRKHPTKQPMFLYVAFQAPHTPLQAPQKYEDMFSSAWQADRKTYAAMGALWDEAVGNIAKALEERGMWEHTLMIVAGDNGGAGYSSTDPHVNSCGGANNFPLYGNKANNFEGGVRTAAFAAGGILPAHVRGTKLEGNIHVGDWYSTFCHLAGVDPFDTAGAALNLPPVDSLSVWPLLSGQNMTTPRYEIPLSVDAPVMQQFYDQHMVLRPFRGRANVSALIQGDYKLMAGLYMSATRQPKDFPDQNSCCRFACVFKTLRWCGSNAAPKCLFNIREDPTEETNVFGKQPKIAKAMTARLQELRKEVFGPQFLDKPDPAAEQAYTKIYGGFIGPWMDLPTAPGQQNFV